MTAEVAGNGEEGGAEDVPATPLALRNRPWHVLSGRLDARLEELAEAPVWTMDATETAETIVELIRVQARLAAVTGRLLAHADRLDVAAESDATSTAAWLRGRVPVTPRTAREAVDLGRALDTGRYPATAEALAAGRLQADQARVVVAAVDALPDRLYAEERLAAEAHLVELGRVYDAQVLRRLGRHLLEVIDPELAEAELARRLEAEEEAAARATSFRLVDDGHGKAHGRFTIPALHGQMLKRLLEAFANPQIPDAIPRTEHRAEDGGEGSAEDGGADGAEDGGADGAEDGGEGSAEDGGEGSAEDGGEGSAEGGGEDGAPGGTSPRRRVVRRPTAAVLGDALVRLVESYPLDRAPASGGLSASVVVTMPVETLTGADTPATLPGTGQDVSATTARRLACAAGTIPAVLDGAGRVLDLGRRSRLATQAQRLALYLQQEGQCAIELCDRPASWADAHHWRKRWTDGGTTDLADLILICPRHHTLAHKARTTVVRTDGGGFRLHHRT